MYATLKKQRGIPDSTAIELEPDLADAPYNLDRALWRLRGQLEEAIASFRKAIELRPDFAHAHVLLGSALREKGELDDAIAVYRRAIELQPDYAGA